MKRIDKIGDLRAGLRHRHLPQIRLAPGSESRASARGVGFGSLRQHGVDGAVPQGCDGIKALVPTLREYRDAAAHGLSDAHHTGLRDESDAGSERSLLQPRKHRAHGEIIGIRERIKGDRLQVRNTAPTDAQRIEGNHYQAGARVVLGLAVGRVPREVHIEIAARIAAARDGEHHDGRFTGRQHVRQISRGRELLAAGKAGGSSDVES